MALFSMGGLKALSPYGVLILLYQNNWDEVGDSLTAWILDIFGNPGNIKLVNKTFISLIPKIGAPENFSHCRPNSLCNVKW